jgi:hypothetical protein
MPKSAKAIGALEAPPHSGNNQHNTTFFRTFVLSQHLRISADTVFVQYRTVLPPECMYICKGSCLPGMSAVYIEIRLSAFAVFAKYPGAPTTPPPPPFYHA